GRVGIAPLRIGLRAEAVKKVMEKIRAPSLYRFAKRGIRFGTRSATPLFEGAAMSKQTDKKRWVRNVKSVSTFPPEGLFTRDAATIARVMTTKKVSPLGLGSAVRMVQFFINRAGKNLPPQRRKELEKAKGLLQARARKREKSARG